MAVNERTIHPFPAQAREFPPLTITAEEIAKYAELSALVSQLEAQQKALRAELLALRAAGAEQEENCPSLLVFVDQERRAINWQAEAIRLPERLFGTERLAGWKSEVEHSATVQAVTQIRVKPNPAYAAGICKAAQAAIAVQYGD
jgi:hypothetical protein